MKRLVYWLLMLGAMVGTVQGQVKNTDSLPPDSLLAHYYRILEKGTDKEVFLYASRMVDLLAQVKDTELAQAYLKKLRQVMTREDVPFVNLIEGDIRMHLHQPDSAMKHYRIVADGPDRHLALLAYERMGKWLEEADTRNDLFKDILIQKDQNDYLALKQKNKLNELQMERQRHIILILGLSVFIILLVGAGMVHFFHRRNLALKQQEELASLRMKEAMLREKNALMREELLKRIHVLEKLEGNEGRILLSEVDWRDVQLMLDSAYPDFTQKLKREFPALTEKDINFCCLVKIHMSLQSLSQIYCISGNSVSRRKLRLKEKLGIDKEDSLTKFLDRLV